MHKATFEVEAVTPIFMRGANQKEVEIRASSIKGLMRWWFRALAGNYFGDDIGKLREAESKVFGSTKVKSKVNVEISSISRRFKPLIYNAYSRGRKVRLNYDKDSHLEKLSYLWFSIKMQVDDFLKEEIGPKYHWNVHQINGALKSENIFYYPSGTKFTVTIKSHEEKSFNLALVSFWALVILGGIGFRNRRGAGSLRLVNTEFNKLETLGLKTGFLNSNEFKSALNKAIDFVGNNLPQKKSKISNLEPVEYPILNEKTSYLGLYGSEKNPIQILNKFQKEYMNKRKIKSREERIVFGTPVTFHIRKGKELVPVKEVEERRASPMHIGVLKKDTSYYTMILKFKTEPFYIKDNINNDVNWEVLGGFDSQLDETPVFGSLEVFK